MMKILASLAVAAASALSLSPTADAAPMTPIQISAVPGGYVGVGVGVGGGGYYGGGRAPSGYYRTEYQWVPTTVFAGYDVYGRPVYTTQYVQQAYQVWVPTYSAYAPGYYARPRVSWGVGFGFGRRWH